MLSQPNRFCSKRVKTPAPAGLQVTLFIKTVSVGRNTVVVVTVLSQPNRFCNTCTTTPVSAGKQLPCWSTTTSTGLATTVREAVSLHAFAPVTVTKYVVVLAGLTVYCAVAGPPCHWYATPPPAVSVVLSPLHTTELPLMVAVGLGFTASAKNMGGPPQPFKVAVAAMSPSSVFTTTGVVNSRLPMPAAGKPMLGLLFVQVTLRLPFPVKGMFTNAPPQALTSAIWSMRASAPTVMVKVRGGAVQPLSSGVTTMVATCVESSKALTNDRLPCPVAARPMTGLLFVHVYTVPGKPMKDWFTVLPEHTEMLGGMAMSGRGLICTVNDSGWPKQVNEAGTTNTVAVCTKGLVVAVNVRLPVPESLKPMFGLLFVHINCAFEEPLNSKSTAWPPQKTSVPGLVTLGIGKMSTLSNESGPIHPFSSACTARMEVSSMVTNAAVVLMLPVPKGRMPVFTLLLVHTMLAPGELAPKKISMGASLHPKYGFWENSTVGAGTLPVTRTSSNQYISTAALLAARMRRRKMRPPRLFTAAVPVCSPQT